MIYSLNGFLSNSKLLLPLQLLYIFKKRKRLHKKTHACEDFVSEYFGPLAMRGFAEKTGDGPFSVPGEFESFEVGFASLGVCLVMFSVTSDSKKKKILNA